MKIIRDLPFPAALLTLCLGLPSQASLAGGAIEISSAELGRFPASSLSLEAEVQEQLTLKAGAGSVRGLESGTLNVTRSVDGVTAKLHAAMATGRVLKTVTVSQPGLTLELQNVLITSISINSNDEADEVAEESLTLKFQQAAITVSEQGSLRGSKVPGSR